MPAPVWFILVLRQEVRMSNQLDIVEAQALKLSPEERAQLADRLVTSLFKDQEIEDAWSAEVERRIEEIESGRAALIPAADSIARARAAIK
ncbi:MAG: addiction module protein [Burkholderiales bacterium]|nr:addiction module protein [Burkholderiales bacterium]